MDLGAELGAKIFVLWGGREGVETDACRRPDEAVKRLRQAVNYLCEYNIDKKYGYKFALEAKPNEPRADIYMATTGHYLGFILTLDRPDMVGVNPEFAHEQMAGLNFLHGVAQAWEADVDGCFLKDLSLNLLVRSLHLIMLGQRILPDQLRMGDPALIARKPTGPVGNKMLSAREEQILRLLLVGDSNKKIASRLNVSAMTVKLHLKALLQKVGANNRTQVAIWAHNHGYEVAADSHGGIDRD